MEAARRAGRKLASNAEAPNTAATQTSVVTSQGGVPKKRRVTSYFRGGMGSSS